MGIQPLGNSNLFRMIDLQPGVVVVMFTAAACGACRQMHAALEQCPELNVIEVDAGEEQALANEFEVFHLPALFVYRNGYYHGALEVEPLPSHIRAEIEALLARPPQDPP